ncbi:hypothetical protein FPV67DRAFT_783182 [Lyophyllum atratum]|nr:hypothetical protein FPV67DRAFT_783182 [Lyophyllum atratum]
MTGFNIRNLSGTSGLSVFVSSYSKEGGNDAWYKVAPNFADPATAHWNRDGWELIAFEQSGIRRGWYINCGGQTVDVTFYGFNQDLGLVRN